MVDVQKRILNRDLRRPARIGDAGFLVPERVDAPELLDQGAGTLENVRVNLDEMWRLGAMLKLRADRSRPIICRFTPFRRAHFAR